MQCIVCRSAQSEAATAAGRATRRTPTGSITSHRFAGFVREISRLASEQAPWTAAILHGRYGTTKEPPRPSSNLTSSTARPPLRLPHGSPPRVQPLTPPPPQPPRLGAHLGAQLGEQLGAQLGGQSEDMPEQQSQDWPDGLLPAVPPRAAEQMGDAFHRSTRRSRRAQFLFRLIAPKASIISSTISAWTHTRNGRRALSWWRCGCVCTRRAAPTARAPSLTLC